ncbi:MAG: hypothetical protein K2L10_11830 [Ruminococcus sp.]|nr:hypothetical protein [Ruminococcus sp.]
MAKKKVINFGKIMVISGAIVILVLVALWCNSLLKISHEQKNDSSEGITQPTMSANVIVPPVITTTTTTTTTTEISEMIQTTSSTELSTDTNSEAITGTLTVKGNGEFQEYIIKLANPALDVHTEPSANSMITGTLTDRGSYVIIKETVDDDGNKWGLLEDNSGWINLVEARKADPNDNINVPSDSGNSGNITYTDDEENLNDNNNDNDNTFDNEHNNNNNYTGNSGGELMGVDEDGDGWDDGFNPDAWCVYCGYDSYYNYADGNYYCSQGHVWSY